MSTSKNKLGNDPRVAVAVVLLLVVVAALRLPALFRELNPGAERDEPGIALASKQYELPLPPNIQLVRERVHSVGETGTRQASASDLSARRETRAQESLRNPFRPGSPELSPPAVKPKPRGGRSKAPTLSCSAVFLGERSSALMDGKIYFVGDRLRSYRVRSINSEGVTLEKNGVKRFLALSRKSNSGPSTLAFRPKAPAAPTEEESR